MGVFFNMYCVRLCLGVLGALFGLSVAWSVLGLTWGTFYKRGLALGHDG